MKWLPRELTRRRRSTLSVDTRMKMDDPVDCEHHWVDITGPFDRVHGVHGLYLVRTYICVKCGIRRGLATTKRADAWSDDIVKRLRKNSVAEREEIPISEAHDLADLLDAAADEIERLRAAITSWADACRRPDCEVCDPEWVWEAEQALRKAVGR